MRAHVFKIFYFPTSEIVTSNVLPWHEALGLWPSTSCKGNTLEVTISEVGKWAPAQSMFTFVSVLYFCMDLSFTGVPLKVTIWLEKLIYWHFCDIHSYIKIEVNVMKMPKNQFLPTWFKLLMVPMQSWDPYKETKNTHSTKVNT